MGNARRRTLRLEHGERLLIRGGTTSVGLAAAAIAKLHGAIVAATTRRPEREMLLRAAGVDQVFIDNGIIAEQVREVLPGGVDKVAELIGTLKDAREAAQGGDEGTNDLIVSQVVRTNELQSWFVGRHLAPRNGIAKV